MLLDITDIGDSLDEHDGDGQATATATDQNTISFDELLAVCKGNAIVFDIETGPLPDDQLEQFYEVPDIKPPGKFDPTSVKLGRLKDERKIAEKIEAAKESHAAAVMAYTEKLAGSFGELRDKAALSAVTGRVLAIGYGIAPDGELRICVHDADGDERLLLEGFWAVFSMSRRGGGKVIGFNNKHFDIPFLSRRSWMLDVSQPSYMDKGKWWPVDIVDLMDRWKLGSYGDHIKLDVMAKAFGLKGKTEGVTGADFARLWTEDRTKAIEYAIDDIRVTYECANRMGVM